jgi:pyruvate/2-oxoglutarate/acetoin dehydrogenase E1 component
MEHRYLFKTTDTLDAIDLNVPRLKAAIYGSDHPDIVILTYGDGVGEALRVLKHCADLAIQVVALTSFPIDLSECTDVVNSLLICEQIIVIDTAHYEFGVMEAIVGRLAVKINISGRVKVFSPAFEPCATSPQLVKDYYPQAPRITDWLVSQNLTKLCMPSYDFDKLHLPFDFDFSEIRPINEVR